MSRKIIFITLISLAIFYPFSRAKADVPVFDARAHQILNLIKGDTGSLVVKEYQLDPLFNRIAKGLIRTLTTQVVNWIKQGDSRGPLFIENFLEHFSREMDNAVGLFLEQYFGRNSPLLGLLCEPFRLTLPSLFNRRGLDYTERARCKLSDIVRNVENFQVQVYFNDFSHGGWDAWFATLDPSANIFGQYLMGVSEQDEIAAGAFLGSQTEVQSTGGGLLSWQQCDDVPIISGNYGPSGEETTEGTYRANCRIVTPGRLVSDSLSDVFGSPFRQLEIADELDEILAAFFQAMISQVLSPSSGGFSGTDFNDLDRNTPNPTPTPTPISRGITINSPVDGAYVSGNIRIVALSSNFSTSTSVQFTLNGTNIGSPVSGSGIYEFILDTSTLPEGAHSITAILLDSGGGRVDESIATRINIDRTNPTISNLAISDNPANVQGNTNFTVEAADNGDERAVTVEFLLNGRPTGQASFINGRHRLNNWDSRNMPNGTYQLTARATDRGGNTASTAPITIIINN